MKSTLHGNLPLIVYPAPSLEVTAGGRVQVCRVRGEALGQRLNVELSLDVNTGELLLMTPDSFVGSFRLGDLIAAHVQQSVAAIVRDRREEGSNAKAH